MQMVNFAPFNIGEFTFTDTRTLSPNDRGATLALLMTALSDYPVESRCSGIGIPVLADLPNVGFQVTNVQGRVVAAFYFGRVEKLGDIPNGITVRSRFMPAFTKLGPAEELKATDKVVEYVLTNDLFLEDGRVFRVRQLLYDVLINAGDPKFIYMSRLTKLFDDNPRLRVSKQAYPADPTKFSVVVAKV